MEKNEKFEVVYMFFDPMDGHMEADYLGEMDAEQVLSSYPEISESQIESVKRNGEATITLNVASGDMVKLSYTGKDW